MSKRLIALPRLLLFVAVAAVLVGSSLHLSAQAPVEKFRGVAINLNGGPSSGTVEFAIERWSTAAERNALLTIIKENKNPTDKLLNALEKMPKMGYLRSTSSLGWELKYAWQEKLDDGGRRIVVATDRPMTFRETVNQPRTTDYPFTFIEMRFNRDDQGQGKILAGSRIYTDKKGNIVLENYAIEPLRFNEIKKVN